MRKALKALGCYEALLASCSYGCIHGHAKVQGAYTKASATYTPGLAKALAETFRDHILTRYEEREDEVWRPNGLEDVLANDVAQSLDWQVVRSWPWKSQSHINLLEIAASIQVLELEAKAGGDVRYASLVDSQVALRSQSKGRSSSLALRHLLKRASSLSVAFGLYQAGRFCPTRLNGADHPTRSTMIPEPTSSITKSLRGEELLWLARVRNLRRVSSNWLRLSLLLCPSWISFFADPSSMAWTLLFRIGLWILIQLLDFLGRVHRCLGGSLDFVSACCLSAVCYFLGLLRPPPAMVTLLGSFKELGWNCLKEDV